MYLVHLLEVLSLFRALTLAKSGTAMGGHLLHLDIFKHTHTHTQPLTHSLTLFLSPLCMHLCTQAHTLALSAQPGLMLAKSNFELTYKYQRFKLLHMALNPIHSNDTLTSHYPVGKYASHSLCTMTSSAMFVKDISSMFFFVSLHTFHFLTSL